MVKLHTRLTEQVVKLSCGHDLTKACFYLLKRWDAFARLLGDGRICLTNAAAERPLFSSYLVAKHGCSADPTVADSALPSSTR